MTADNGANMNTLASESSKYYDCDYSLVVNTRQIQDIIGSIGLNQFKEILDGGIPNFPVRCEDALVSQVCFRTNMHLLKGNMARKTKDPTRTDFAPLKHHIIYNYGDIKVCAELIKVNGVFFLMLIFNKFSFATQSTVRMVR